MPSPKLSSDDPSLHAVRPSAAAGVKPVAAVYATLPAFLMPSEPEKSSPTTAEPQYGPKPQQMMVKPLSSARSNAVVLWPALEVSAADQTMY